MATERFDAEEYGDRIELPAEFGDLGMEPLARLSRDMKRAATVLTTEQARFLVDLYYTIQDYRIRAGGQHRALGESGEPHQIIEWVFSNHKCMEGDIRVALGRYAESQVPGVWALSICGIGPVLAAGLLAHVDIAHCPTVGHLWRFAGLDPSVEWLGTEKAAKLVTDIMGTAKEVTAEHLAQIAFRSNRKIENITKLATDKEGKLTRAALRAGLAKRPWNARLRVIAWKLGESFVKVSGNEHDIYGHVWAARKGEEIERNERGDYAAQAAAVLASKRIGHDTDAYKAYAQGKLPPAHIHARAKRYAVKLFLSAYQEVAYWAQYHTLPPKPYAISQLGHVHCFEVPHLDLLPGLLEAKAAK